MKNENDISNLLKGYQTPDMQDPFMGARVAAIAGSEKSLQKKVNFWRIFGLANAVAALALVVVLNHNAKTVDFEKAPINTAVVLQIDNSIAMEDKLIRAQIVLPDDVVFVAKNENIVNMRELTVQLESFSQGKLRLPFVVKATKPGNKTFKIKFFDNGLLVDEKEVTVKFVKA